MAISKIKGLAIALSMIFVPHSATYAQSDEERLLQTFSCINCNFEGANLSQRELSGIDVRGSNFSRAQLWWSDLSGAQLDSVTLNDANISGSNLNSANLSGANL